MNRINSTKIASQARKGTIFIFLVCGIALASWAPMVPFAKSRLQLNDAELGSLLLFLGIGAILSMPLTGLLIRKFGSRNIMITASLVLGMILPCLILVNSIPLMALALFVFGAGIGTVDVSVNSHALAVQKLYGKHIMSSFHGMFSVGGLIGSLGLGFLIKMGLNEVWASVSVGLLLIFISLYHYRTLLTHSDELLLEEKNNPTIESSSNGQANVWLNKQVIFLGIMCFILFLAEGAVLDWGALYLREELQISIEMAGMGFAVFSVAMAIMRLTGDRLIEKFQLEKIVMIGTLIGASGFFLIVLMPSIYTALLGFVLIGLGVANVIPLLFTKGAEIPGLPSYKSLPAITTLGYAGQLIGPAFLGFVAFQTSLPIALGLSGVLLLVVSFSYLWLIKRNHSRLIISEDN